MTWKDVGDFVSKVAPMAGTILGGPAGGTIGTAISAMLGVENKPDKVLEALNNNPDAILKIKEFESNERIALQKLLIESETNRLIEETKQIQAVNETMRAEVMSQNKWSAFWRPYWGVISGTAFGVVCVFVCYLAYKAIIGKDPSAMTMIPQLITSFTMLFGIPGAILGVSAWHRGMMQREKNKI